jgi:hypothetical protein
MPFDCMPAIENPNPLDAGSYSPLALSINPSKRNPDEVTAVLALHPHRGPEGISSTIAVLVRARSLIADERHWCQWSFARGWAKIPVPPRSRFARRFCAIGAVKRAACELLLPSQNARIALERQTGREVERWNDDPRRTHAEVIAVFDGAIADLEANAV